MGYITGLLLSVIACFAHLRKWSLQQKKASPSTTSSADTFIPDTTWCTHHPSVFPCITSISFLKEFDIFPVACWCLFLYSFCCFAFFPPYFTPHLVLVRTCATPICSKLHHLLLPAITQLELTLQPPLPPHTHTHTPACPLTSPPPPLRLGSDCTCK